MRRPVLTILAVFLALALALPAAAQDLLPPRFADWASGPMNRTRAQNLEQLVGNDAAILREYGCLAVERRAYTRGDRSLTVTLYRMRDPTGGYGAYSFLRSEQMPPADLAEYSAMGSQLALALAGNLVVEFSGTDLRPLQAEMKEFLKQLLPQADTGPYPTLAHYLPARGRIENSERYVLGPVAMNRLLPLGNGDWLGFADRAEAQLARYRISGQEVTLLLAAYPTPQAAAQKLEELGRWFNLNASQGQEAGRPVIYARRSSSLLALVAETRSPELAASLLNQIRYETQLTWNEPGFTATESSFAEMMVAIFVGTGVLLVFALAAGIGFGGFRLVVKHFLPGKVFDRPSNVEIIQLGLSSKPIEAKDFYEVSSHRQDTGFVEGLRKT